LAAGSRDWALPLFGFVAIPRAIGVGLKGWKSGDSTRDATLAQTWAIVSGATFPWW